MQHVTPHDCKTGEVDQDTLYVVAVLSNPRRFKRRPQLFSEFRQRMLATEGIHLVVVEALYGERDSAISPEGEEMVEQYTHHLLHIDGRAEIWLKESLINYGVARLPCGWKKVAWIDGDITFCNDAWVQETKYQLEHFPFVQLFQTACDLGPNGETLQLHHGFGWNHAQGLRRRPGYTSWHPGYAWACTAEAWNVMGGLPDFAILGSADFHLATALIGKVDESVSSELVTYKSMLVAMQERLHTGLHGDLLGYVNGTILHSWHGRKADRKYVQRKDILLKHKYDPIKHIHYDANGLVTLNRGLVEFQADLRKYFVQRQEDSIDT